MTNLVGVWVVVGCLLFGGAAEATGQFQEWKAPGKLGVILASQASLFPGLVGDSYESAAESQEECSFLVYRPYLLDPAEKNAHNRLDCRTVGPDGDLVELSLPLPDLAVEGWGNTAEEEYYSNLGKPLNFQVLNQDFNLRMYQGLKKNYPHRLVEELVICDPNGYVCLSNYSLMQDSPEKYRKAYLSCSVETEGGKPTRNQCIFLNP